MSKFDQNLHSFAFSINNVPRILVKENSAILSIKTQLIVLIVDNKTSTTYTVAVLNLAAVLKPHLSFSRTTIKLTPWVHSVTQTVCSQTQTT